MNEKPILCKHCNGQLTRYLKTGVFSCQDTMCSLNDHYIFHEEVGYKNKQAASKKPVPRKSKEYNNGD